MLVMLGNAVELLRTHHKNGEEYYWLLYYTYLSPQKLMNLDEIIDQLRPHVRDISPRTYYRKRGAAVEALSSVLWGYASQDTMGILEEFFPGDLSEAEIMEITHFERGNGLISTNNNNVTVEIKCSQLEKELITTDRRELQELLDRSKAQEMG